MFFLLIRIFIKLFGLKFFVKYLDLKDRRNILFVIIIFFLILIFNSFIINFFYIKYVKFFFLF